MNEDARVHEQERLRGVRIGLNALKAAPGRDSNSVGHDIALTAGLERFELVSQPGCILRGWRMFLSQQLKFVC